MAQTNSPYVAKITINSVNEFLERCLWKVVGQNLCCLKFHKLLEHILKKNHFSYYFYCVFRFKTPLK